MNIHEYQAKELFNEYNIPVSNGSVAFSKKEIEQSVKEIPGPIWVVKAQIHAGGRVKVEELKLFHLLKRQLIQQKKCLV